MKKLLAILTLALFIGGISAPVFATDLNSATVTELADKDPKKDKKKSKSEKKSDAKKSSGCETKKSDCSKSCDGKTV